MKQAGILALALLAGCAVAPADKPAAESQPVAATAPQSAQAQAAAPQPQPAAAAAVQAETALSAAVIFSPPPQLWSAHKVLEISPEACAEEALAILKALQFISVAKNGTYVYGTLLSNRAAVKCVPHGKGTFVYTAVAGPDKEQVGRLRNEIFWRL